MEALLGPERFMPEVWKEILSHLPMWWRAMCCRVCKAWQEDLELPQQGQGDDILVDYGLGTLCSVLAAKGVDEVMTRIRLRYPSGIAADLGRMDQVRRFVQRYQDKHIESVDLWMQLASQEPDAGWLCKGVSRTHLQGRGKRLMRQVVGKPQDFSMLLDTLGHSDTVHFLCYSPDGSTIASACSDGTVRLFDAKTMEEKGMLGGHSEHNPECTCNFHAGGDAYEDEANPECPVKGHSGQVVFVAFSPDGSQLASSGGWGDNSVRLWDPKTMEHKGTLRGHERHNPECICYDEDGDFEFDEDCPVVDPRLMCTVRGHSRRVFCVAYSPDNLSLASASYDGTVKLWDLSGEMPVEKGTLKGHFGTVTCVAYSPDSKSLASASWDGTVKLWDLSGETPVEKGTLKGHSGRVRSVAYSPDSKSLASANDDGTVKLWDLLGETPVEKGTLWGHSRAVRCVAYSPDGKRIASASDDGTVKLWDLSGETPVEKGTLRGQEASWQHLDPETKALAAEVQSARSKRTGQYIVRVNCYIVYVYRTDSDGKKQGKPLACFPSPDTVTAVSCKGTSVAVGCEDGQVGVAVHVFCEHFVSLSTRMRV